MTNDFSAGDAAKFMRTLADLMDKLPTTMDASTVFEAFSEYLVRNAPDGALIAFAHEAAEELQKRKERLDKQRELQAVPQNV